MMKNRGNQFSITAAFVIRSHSSDIFYVASRHLPVGLLVQSTQGGHFT